MGYASSAGFEPVFTEGKPCKTEKKFNPGSDLRSVTRKLIRSIMVVTPARRDVDITLERKHESPMQISQYEPMRFAPVELLPPGFTYPGSYVEYTLSESFVDGPHWEWCLVDKESFVLLLEAVRQLYPERVLVPFMHVNGDDGVACFDASQPSSDPPVFCGTILEKDASGRGYRWGEYDNFIQWKLLVPERLPN